MEFKGVTAGYGEVSGPHPLSVLILPEQTSGQGMVKVKCDFLVKERENSEREKGRRSENYYTCKILGLLWLG